MQSINSSIPQISFKLKLIKLFFPATYRKIRYKQLQALLAQKDQTIAEKKQAINQLQHNISELTLRSIDLSVKQETLQKKLCGLQNKSDFLKGFKGYIESKN